MAILSVLRLPSTLIEDIYCFHFLSLGSTLLKISFGSVRSLVGISFHSFAPILENDFRSISTFDFLI